MMLAHHEAEGCNELTPEHILIGLRREGYGVGGATLKNFGIELDVLRDRAVKHITQRKVRTDEQVLQVSYSPEALAVWQRAEEWAKRLGHIYIGTEHLLLGVLGNAGVVETLKELGIPDKEVRRECLYLLGFDEAGDPLAKVADLTPTEAMVKYKDVETYPFIALQNTSTDEWEVYTCTSSHFHFIAGGFDEQQAKLLAKALKHVADTWSKTTATGIQPEYPQHLPPSS